MIIYFLLFSVLLLLFGALICSKGEIIAPTVVICLGFIISIVAAIYNKDYWNLHIHWNTYFVIVGGIAIFIIIGSLWQYLYEKRYCSFQNKFIKNKIQEIKVENWKVTLLIICTILISVVYYDQVVRIVRMYRGTVGWTETMYYFRQYVSYGKTDAAIPIVIEQSYQMFNFCGYVCIYIAVHNYFATKKVQKNLLVLICLLLFSSFLNSSRIDIIRYPIATITFYGILSERVNGKRLTATPKLVFKIFLLFILLCIIFVLLKQVAGRIDNRDPLYYITYYLGQSIHNLDCYLQDNHTKSEVWGKETFYGLNHLLKIITGNEKYNYIAHKEFRFYRGQSIGNVYTTFRAFLNDFGYIGFVTLTSLFSFIINLLYLKLKSEKYKNREVKYSIKMTFYGYIMYTVYVSFYTDFFFNRLVSLGMIKLILSFYIWYLFLAKIKIKCR